MKTRSQKITALMLMLMPLLASAQTITTYAGNGTQGYSGNGVQATTAELNYPNGTRTDAAGNLYFSDGNYVRKVSTSGVITTIAGNGTPGYTGDGGQATAAELKGAGPLCIDASGNIFFADQGGYANVVRKISTAGVITTVAGGGNGGDGGPATSAVLNWPNGICVDGGDDLFISELNGHDVREVIASSGNIYTVVGTPGQSAYGGDGGPANQAYLDNPAGMCFDASLNLYIADWANNVIRKVNSSTGIITTVVGNGYDYGEFQGGYTGDGGQATNAELALPNDVFVSSNGTLYVADASNYVIRKVNTSGVISTIAGNNVSGYSGDGAQATAAELSNPGSVCTDGNGNLFIADAGNHRIRRVSAPAGIAEVKAQNNISIYPNPATDDLNIQFKGPQVGDNYSAKIVDMAGREIMNTSYTIDSNIKTIDVSSLTTGIYFLVMCNQQGEITTQKFIKQ